MKEEHIDLSSEAAEKLGSARKERNNNNQQDIEMQDFSGDSIAPGDGDEEAAAEASKIASTIQQGKLIAKFNTDLGNGGKLSSGKQHKYMSAATPEQQAIDKICFALQERMVVQNTPKASRDMTAKAALDSTFQPFRDQVRDQLTQLDEDQKKQLVKIANNQKEFDKTINNLVLGLQSVAETENKVNDKKIETSVTHKKADSKINGMKARKEAIRDQLQKSFNNENISKGEVALRAVMWSIADFVAASCHMITGKPQYMENYLSNKNLVITDVETLQKSFEKDHLINPEVLQNIMKQNAQQQIGQDGPKTVGNSTFYTKGNKPVDKRSSVATLFNPNTTYELYKHNKNDSEVTLVPASQPNSVPEKGNKRFSSASTLYNYDTTKDKGNEPFKDENKRASTATVRLPESGTDMSAEQKVDSESHFVNPDFVINGAKVKIDSNKEEKLRHKNLLTQLSNAISQAGKAISSQFSRGGRDNGRT